MMVYLVRNRINGKVYVGITTTTLKKRWYLHCYEADNGRKNYRFYSAITKYGKDSFDISVLESAPDMTSLFDLERSYISKFSSNDKNFGYNMTTGGEGVFGESRIKKHSEETKAKMRASAAGHIPIEAIRRAAELRRGTHPSEETRMKLSIARKGKGPPEWARKKANEALSRKWANDPEYRNKMMGIINSQKRATSGRRADRRRRLLERAGKIS